MLANRSQSVTQVHQFGPVEMERFDGRAPSGSSADDQETILTPLEMD
jgi:hypothetical protein